MLLGLLMIALGVAALVHPTVKTREKEREIEVGAQKVIIETTRVVTIPPILSGFVILAGAGLTYLSMRKS
jgi:hypothetical protein